MAISLKKKKLSVWVGCFFKVTGEKIRKGFVLKNPTTSIGNVVVFFTYLGIILTYNESRAICMISK